MKFVHSMIVPCKCCILFEMSCQSVPGTPILTLFFCLLAVEQKELTSVQNCPVIFVKIQHVKK